MSAESVLAVIAGERNIAKKRSSKRSNVSVGKPTSKHCAGANPTPPVSSADNLFFVNSIPGNVGQLASSLLGLQLQPAEISKGATLVSPEVPDITSHQQTAQNLAFTVHSSTLPGLRQQFAHIMDFNNKVEAVAAGIAAMAPDAQYKGMQQALDYLAKNIQKRNADFKSHTKSVESIYAQLQASLSDITVDFKLAQIRIPDSTDKLVAEIAAAKARIAKNNAKISGGASDAWLAGLEVSLGIVMKFYEVPGGDEVLGAGLDPIKNGDPEMDKAVNDNNDAMQALYTATVSLEGKLQTLAGIVNLEDQSKLMVNHVANVLQVYGFLQSDFEALLGNIGVLQETLTQTTSAAQVASLAASVDLWSPVGSACERFLLHINLPVKLVRETPVAAPMMEAIQTDSQSLDYLVNAANVIIATPTSGNTYASTLETLKDHAKEVAPLMDQVGSSSSKYPAIQEMADEVIHMLEANSPAAEIKPILANLNTLVSIATETADRDKTDMNALLDSFNSDQAHINTDLALNQVKITTEKASLASLEKQANDLRSKIASDQHREEIEKAMSWLFPGLGDLIALIDKEISNLSGLQNQLGKTSQELNASEKDLYTLQKTASELSGFNSKASAVSSLLSNAYDQCVTIKNVVSQVQTNINAGDNPFAQLANMQSASQEISALIASAPTVSEDHEAFEMETEEAPEEEFFSEMQATAAPKGAKISTKDGVKDTASGSLVIQTYVQTILSQAVLKLSLLENMEAHQKTAKTHATSWRSDVYPQLNSTLTDFIDYSHKFQNALDNLNKMIGNADTQQKINDVKMGARYLYSNSQTKEQAIKTVSANLLKFYTEILSDQANFNADKQESDTKITGNKGVIAQLKKEISATNSAISKDTGLIAGGAVLAVVGGLMIAVGVLAEIETFGASTALVVGGLAVVAGGAVMAGLGGKDLAKQNANLKKFTTELTNDQNEVTALEQASTVLNTFVTQNNAASTAVSNIQTSWVSLGNLFQESLTELDSASTDTEVFAIMTDLSTANSDFQDTMKIAQNGVGLGQLPSGKPVG